jgi:hypothetical protein
VGHGKGCGLGETEGLEERKWARGNGKARGKEVGHGKGSGSEETERLEERKWTRGNGRASAKI